MHSDEWADWPLVTVTFASFHQQKECDDFLCKTSMSPLFHGYSHFSEFTSYCCSFVLKAQHFLFNVAALSKYVICLFRATLFWHNFTFILLIANKLNIAWEWLSSLRTSFINKSQHLSLRYFVLIITFSSKNSVSICFERWEDCPYFDPQLSNEGELVWCQVGSTKYFSSLFFKELFWCWLV